VLCCNQGVYCCVKEDHYRAYAVAPILIVIFTAVALMSLCYFKAYRSIKATEYRLGSVAGKNEPGRQAGRAGRGSPAKL
jgi:hypothetical protein